VQTAAHLLAATGTAPLQRATARLAAAGAAIIRRWQRLDEGIVHCLHTGVTLLERQGAGLS
jgi:hypothetical protein